MKPIPPVENRKVWKSFFSLCDIKISSFELTFEFIVDNLYIYELILINLHYYKLLI